MSDTRILSAEQFAELIQFIGSTPIDKQPIDAWFRAKDSHAAQAEKLAATSQRLQEAESRLVDYEARYLRYQELYPGAINRIDELVKSEDLLAQQAERIRELERPPEWQDWERLIDYAYKMGGEGVLNVNRLVSHIVVLKEERDAALQLTGVAEALAANHYSWRKANATRADNAEDLLRQIREVLPAKRAREIAASLETGYGMSDNLEAYAALVEEKS